MAEEAQSTWMEKFDVVLKVLTGVLIPVTIVVAGHLIASQQQKESDAALKQQREIDLAQRNADRAGNLLNSLSSENPRQRQLAIRVVEHLIKSNQFPAELGPALVTISFTDTDPEVARVASEALPQAFKAHPDLEKDATAETQRILKNNGYYNGEVDGTNNETTREALRRFQQENGIESDGAARPRTLQKLRDTQQKKQSEQPAPQRPLLRGRR